MALNEESRCLAAASLRWQLQPGRFRFASAQDRLVAAYMLEAAEWVRTQEKEPNIVSARLLADGTLALYLSTAFAHTKLAVMLVESGSTYLNRLAEDVILRAELNDDSDEAAFLRSHPRVIDDRLSSTY